MKNILPLAGISLVGTAVVGLPSADAKPQGTQRPNILWIMAEDMAQDLACYGRTDVRTPNLDRLAAEGILFTNARCSAPISSPSRSGMMTGHQCTTFDAQDHRSNRKTPLPQEIVPFTKYLRDAGYTCILGATDTFASPSGNNSQSSRKVDCNFRYDEIGEYDGVEHFGLFDKYNEILPEDAPFFSQVTLFVTHRGDWWRSIRSASTHPVNPDKVVLPSYMADHPKVREEFACYLDQVEYMDNEVGRLLQNLESKNLLDNTVIFFIGDNGRADVRGKGYLYNDGARVPMIIWGKGIMSSLIDNLSSTLDITATILQLAGCPIPSNYESKPLLDKDLRYIGERDNLFASRDRWDEVRDCIRSITDGKYLYIRNFTPQVPYDSHQLYLDFHRPALHVMRQLHKEGRLTAEQALFFAPTKPDEELYDYLADPDCVHNLATDPAYSEIVARLRAELDERHRQYKDYGYEKRNDNTSPEGHKPTIDTRTFVQEYYPEGWQRLTEGEICDCYSLWRKEYKQKVRQ